MALCNLTIHLHMRRIEFLAAVFCIAVACLLVGGMNLYEKLEFSFYGKPAFMELAEPTKKRIVQPTDQGTHLMDVKYVGAEGGELVVRGKKLWGDAARRVGRGERVQITYLQHRPERVMFQFDELDSPWGWLGVGVIAMSAFVYGLQLRRRHRAA